MGLKNYAALRDRRGGSLPPSRQNNEGTHLMLSHFPGLKDVRHVQCVRVSRKGLVCDECA